VLVHQAYTVLRGALSEAVRQDLVKRNVASLVRMRVPRSVRQLVWSVEDARTFLSSAKRDDDPLFAGYVLLLVLGLRRGEVLGLAWEDLDLEAGEAWSGSGLVLTARLGDPLDPRNFHRWFETRAEKAGVPVIPVHATRRTCASLLVALDVHPWVAMAIMRHSKIAVTMDIYAQVSSESTRAALQALGDRLGEGA
jgi:integrase